MTPRRAAALAAALGLALLWAGTETSLSGWTAGSVANGSNDTANASLAFTHTYPSGSCAITARGSGTAACAASPLPTATVTAGGVAVAAAISNDGTLTAAGLVSDFRATACGPVKLVDSKTAADPMLPRFATAFRQADPWGSSGAVSLSGGAYTADVVATNTGSLLGSSYALGVWFKVANGYTSGGALISLGASAVDGTSAAGSPMVWMDNAGKIRFRVSGTLGTSSSNVSAAAYNDGSWHLAVLSVSAAIFSTPTLYVDNASGVSTGGLTVLTGGNAYWHLGWADFTGVSGPTSATLTGSLAGAFATSTTVSPATRTSLYGAASASAYSTAVLALSSIDHLWMADDTGTTTYTGTLPTIGATSPCTMVDITWATTSPAGTISAAGTTLSAFANGTFHTVTAPGPGSTQTSTITLIRDATWNAYVAGLRLYTPLEHRIQAVPAGGPWIRTFSWADSATVAIA